MDATTSSHHLSPLPTAENTRDGYVQQASPSPRQQAGTCMGGGEGRHPTHSVVVTNSESSPCLGSTSCILHLYQTLSMRDFTGASQ